MVDKLLAYDKAPRSYDALLVADSGDRDVFVDTNQAVRKILPAGMQVSSIKRGNDDATHAQVLAGINGGPSITHYAGHGSVDLWRGGVLSNDDAPALANDHHPSFFVMMTCLNGYFVDPGLDGLGESLLRDDGGAIGAYASTGLTYAREQRKLTLAFNQALYGAGSPRVGDAVMAAARSARDKDILKTWVLLGDPSMRVR
jgi:hypothetical protein